MGTVVFWILFLALIITSLIINLKNSQKRSIKRKEEIKNSFGKFERSNIERVDYTKVEGLYKHLLNEKNIPVIDSVTSHDLSLELLFNSLNNTLSSPGEEYLYYKLNSLNQDFELAKDERKLIDYYCNHEELRNNTLFCLDELSKLKKIDSFNVIRDLKNKKSGNNFVHYLSDFLLLLSILCIFVFPGLGFVATIIILVVNSATYFSGKRQMEEDIYGFAYSLSVIRTAKKIHETDNSCKIDKYKDLFLLSKGNYLISFKRGTTSNPITIILNYLNLFLHFDLITYNRKLNMIKDKADDILELYTLIGRIDCAISMASFVSSLQNCSYPEFVDFSEGFDIKEMIHPLNTNPVPNDIKVSRGIVLTGSNASGKSTFLKTCGVNVIMAQNFGFAMAKSYKAPIVRLYSSISLNDSIVEGNSFFVAEAKSLKRICDATTEFDNVFCLIDEVLKGTNTLERISSGVSVLEYLAKRNCIVFAATHDAELSVMLNELYDSYYFTEIIENGIMKFPYKINKGVAGEGNAIGLLKLLEFDNCITDNAEKLCVKYKEKGRWD